MHPAGHLVAGPGILERAPGQLAVGSLHARPAVVAGALLLSMYHETFWVAVTAAAPVIALAAIVAFSDSTANASRMRQFQVDRPLWTFPEENRDLAQAKARTAANLGGLVALLCVCNTILQAVVLVFSLTSLASTAAAIDGLAWRNVAGSWIPDRVRFFADAVSAVRAPCPVGWFAGSRRCGILRRNAGRVTVNRACPVVPGPIRLPSGCAASGPAGP